MYGEARLIAGAEVVVAEGQRGLGLALASAILGTHREAGHFGDRVARQPAGSMIERSRVARQVCSKGSGKSVARPGQHEAVAADQGGWSVELRSRQCRLWRS